MQKYGAQRATDDGPLCPKCGRVVTRDTAKAWYGPDNHDPIEHADCDEARKKGGRR